MVEPISLAIGVVPLFHSCLEYLQLFKTAQSATLDVQVLLFQLDCHHEDLIIWGEKHGFFEDTQPSVQRPKDLLSRLENAFRLLETLFKDSAALQERYGVVVSKEALEHPAADVDDPYPSSAGLRRLNWRRATKAKTLFNDTEQQAARPSLGVLQKTRWAIYDKKKFEELVKKIGEMVSLVEKILPVPDEFRNQTALRDIMPLINDLERLKLFQAASASIRPAWANTASGLIIASEAASVRGPATVSHWIEQVEDGDETNLDDVKAVPTQGGARPVQKRSTFDEQTNEEALMFPIPPEWRLWFVFVPTCLSSSVGLSCETKFQELVEECPAFIEKNDSDKQWGLGPKIRNHVKTTASIVQLEDMLEKLSSLHYEIQGELKDVIVPIASQAFSEVHIYCAPCRCAVRTAVILCDQYLGDKVNCVRIDDRISSACCTTQRNPKQLQTFVETVNAQELGQWDLFPPLSTTGYVDYIDKEWIENRLFNLESTLYEGEGHEDRFKCAESLFKDMEKNMKIHSILLLEANSGAWILQTPPFRRSPRMPKEFEIFKYWAGYFDKFEEGNTYRGTFTPSRLAYSQPDPQKSRKRPREE